MIRTASGLLRQWRSVSMFSATTAFLLAVATVFFPNNVYAHAGNSDPNVIHACVQQGSKQVRIVGVNGDCTNAETPAHWSVVGPEGPAGPRGPMGPAGPMGPIAPAGATGSAGPMGPSGPAGATGATGFAGPMGPSGPAGATGATGPMGLSGPAGATGSMGPMGPTGPAGTDGAKGADGAQGPAGTPAMLGLAIVTALPDVRLTTALPTNTWFVVTKRSVSLNKVSSTSKLRITYQDTLGTRASFYNACQWRIVMDQTALEFFSDGDLEGSYGWRMHNGTHTTWVFDVPAGSHEIHIENLRTPSATDCLSGWNTTGNFLSVEEIP